MNAGQLIEELQRHDPETMVCVRGYEEGVDEIGGVVEMFAYKIASPEDWEGEYSASLVHDENYSKQILWLRK